MAKLYAYTTETYSKQNWIKIGQTTLENIEERVFQQDGTSNPEPLQILQTWDGLPDHVTDHLIHADLESKGIKPTRIDKSREWYVCTIDDVRRSINDVAYGVAKPNNYPPRDEQRACVEQAAEYFRSGGTEFLMNAKMRYGKTFTSYLIAKELDLKSILVVTYKPAVKSGWKEDLENHVAFDGWSFSASKYDANANVMFASFQDFNDFKKKSKWDGVEKHHFDMIVIDEMHYGSSTERAQETLRSLSYDRTLFVSGTPLKALLSGRFTDENTYTWSYADEQKKRKAEKAGGWDTEVYRWLPPMEIHTFEVCDEAKKNLSVYSDDEGFTMTKMFGADDNGFIDEASVKLFLDQVFGRGVRKNKSPFRTAAPDHSFWVMPVNVKSAAAMAKLLETMVGDEYHIINASGDKVSDLNKAKKDISFYDKTITLSCGRFNTGTTVPEWDAVLMLNDTKSPETYFQSIFRAQSPDKARGKEQCYVFDFNPERVMEMVYSQAEIEATKKKTINENVRSFLEFAPIIDHAGNELTKVDPEEIISFITETSRFVDKYESSNLINTDISIDDMSKFSELLNVDGGVKNPSIRREFTSNGVGGGKNYSSSNKNRTGNKKVNFEKKVKDEFISKAKYVNKHIPEFIRFVHNANSVQELITANKKKFKEHFGISIETFELMLEVGFLIEARLNRLIAGTTDSYEHTLKAIEYARDGKFVSEDLLESMLPAEAINKNSNIGVVSAYGIIPMLDAKGYTNVSLIVEDMPRASIVEMCKAYNVKIVIKEDTMKKFDSIIMNPPYNGKAALHQQFFNWGVDNIVDDGLLVSIHPAVPYHNKKRGASSTERDMEANLRSYEVKVEFKTNKVFDTRKAKVATSLAVTTLTKTKSNGNIKEVTFVNGNTYYDIPLEYISRTEMDPVVYKGIADKFKAYVKVHGSVYDRISKDPNVEKAYIQKVRGNVGKDDFYTIVSNEKEYYCTGKEYGERFADNAKNRGKDKVFVDDYGVALNDINELNNFFDYAQSYVARMGLALLKFTLNNHSGELRLVPLVDFTRTWSDDELYSLLNLTDEEVATIEALLPNFHNR